ncbi:uncharacterized protein EI90DRAFT_2606309 [Cantharellus anzutake]|uniref:uncharacterized protein n=1 Tax=Cantharellus anzutake TaxID=1750568 RepID=UPI0019081162|nr:uncharacterized protein EI90DRAFT_2606309 [Cantharellus anzutake]KAF8320602.1 hypothetical protein EI90DRAFT_2606309 [Cantharellus anzutake]
MADDTEGEQNVQSVADANVRTLGPGAEYRFELEKGSNLTIKLVEGNAEVFGAELAEGRPYVFWAECKACVFTWHGCKLEVTGQASTEYISEETSMAPILNLHLLLEQMRIRAHRSSNGTPSDDDKKPEKSSNPPRVLVVGPENSGKTTAAKVLLNYAVRSPAEWQPILVNLDTSDGGFTVPGTLSAAPLDSPILSSSPSTTLGGTASTAPSAVSSSALMPITYWFGYPEPKKSPAVMEQRIKDLSARIRERQQLDQFGYTSGIIIDTGASFSLASPFTHSDHKYPLIQWAVEAFDVNVIVVIGHEKLNVEVQRLFNQASSSAAITVVKIPKSGGVVEVDHAYKERVISHQILSYFYGSHQFLPQDVTDVHVETSLSPFSSDIGFDELLIYRIGGESIAPSSALPIGSQAIVTELKPIRVDPGILGSGLSHTVLALLSPLEHETTGDHPRNPQMRRL